MDVVNFPIGSDVKVDISLSSGNVVLTITVGAKVAIDTLLDDVKAKLPAQLQPMIDMVKAGADAALA